MINKIEVKCLNNLFNDNDGRIIYFKNKTYIFFEITPNRWMIYDDDILTKHYHFLSTDFINDNFKTIEDIRNINIDKILKFNN